MEQALLLILKFKYLILLPLAAIEGPIVSLIAGFLVYSGYLNPIISFIILILGDVIPDSIYYYIGRFGNKRDLQSKIKIISNNYKTIETMWLEHGKKTMFLGKLAYGLSNLFLINAGLVKMPFKRFMTYAFIVTIIQFGIFMFIGYYLGGSYDLISRHIKDAEMLIAIFAILFFTVYLAFSKYARKKVLEFSKKENEKVS